MGENGLRVDVEDADNLGPFVTYDGALTAIQTFLTEGASELANAGSEFAFVLSSGFDGLNEPATFLEFNRAIAARVSVYQGDYTTAAQNLAASFHNPASPLTDGAYHVFSATGLDVLNPVFFAPGSSGELRVAHPSYIDDAEAGDTRLDKVIIRSDTAFQDDLSGNYDVFVYKTNVDPIPIIRNEELVLIDAEIKAMDNDPGGAVAAIDVVRLAAGLPAYTGGTTQADLMDEIVMQRRYSLYGEGHRWVDMRRLGRLGELPIDRAGDDVWDRFPIPANEQ